MWRLTAASTRSFKFIVTVAHLGGPGAEATGNNGLDEKSGPDPERWSLAAPPGDPGNFSEIHESLGDG